MANWVDIRKRHNWLMRNTALILSHTLDSVSQSDATTYRDGENGWTILEVVAHLRDFDGFFRNRAIMIRDQETPELPAYDHEQLAIERRYNEQDLKTVLAEYQASRAETANFFRSLTEEQWERTGIHPERGVFSLTDAIIQVGMHDTEHLEQITRILLQLPSKEATY